MKLRSQEKLCLLARFTQQRPAPQRIYAAGMIRHHDIQSWMIYYDAVAAELAARLD